MAYTCILSVETNNEFRDFFSVTTQKKWIFDNEIKNIPEYIKKLMAKNKRVKLPFTRLDIDCHDENGVFQKSLWIVKDFPFDYTFRYAWRGQDKGIEVSKQEFFDTILPEFIKFASME